jgi:hypothetical protein
MAKKILPQAFADLEPFAKSWALATEEERVQKRYASSMSEIQAFYDAMLPRTERAIEHLNQFPLDELPEAEQQLLYLCFSLTEASIAVEIFQEPQVPYGYDPMRYFCSANGNPSLPYGHGK